MRRRAHGCRRRRPWQVGALLARTIAAEAAPACGYALACASNLTAQPALRRALEAAPGAEAALRRTARQTHGVADARYAKMVLDGLQKQRGVGAPLRPQSAAARPQSARPQLAHGKENSGSLRVLQSPRLQATVRRVSSFGRSRRPQLSASPMPQPFDLLAGSAV